ncbi:hypothetical protein AURDEDRAFT_184563 [Auricularia subglabra TFB-10046 SS5]|nr:hypothetical protein AURDEDRAFT_184563 [Auricularia subglabra TFB-10046 SS5]
MSATTESSGLPPPHPPPDQWHDDQPYKSPLSGSDAASQPLATDPSVNGGDSPIDSPVLIGGIAAAGAALLALIVWLSWVLLRSKRQRRSRTVDAEGRPKLPPDWVTAVEQFNRAKSPHSSHKAKPTAALASQFAFPHNGPGAAASKEGYAFTSPSASSSSSSVPPARPAVPARHTPSPLRPQEVSKPKPLPHQTRPLSRDEFRILDHHTQTNTIPLPFARVQPADVARIQAAVHNRSGSHSTTQSWRRASGLVHDPAAAMSPPRKPFSIASSHALSKHHSTAGSVASSFSFASMPYRGSTLGALQEDSASAVVPPVALIQPGMHVVKVAFTALLPDEVNVAVEDRVTVVDVYDDGWCVVLKSGDDDVMMGAVPAWCFDTPSPDEPEGFERTRPERKSSLGVTVELEEPDTSGQSSRHDSVFSWSNF